MIKIIAYKYRIYPNLKQQELLEKHFGCCRWVYNYGLQRKIEVYAKEKRIISRFDLQKEVALLKKKEDTKWLSVAAAQSLQESLVHLDKAYTRFFRDKKVFPKFKSKKENYKSVSFAQQTRVDFSTNKVFVIKFKEGIKCKLYREFTGRIKTSTISKVPSGKYFISILVEEEVEDIIQKPINVESALGIDLGIKSFIVDSSNREFDNPKFLRKSEKKLAREQKRLARKTKGGKNREKQKIKVARVYEKISNQRNDFLHKTSRQLVNDNQVNTFCIENLNIKGMVKNHNLAKSISDCGWGTFVKYLTYKSKWAGKNILMIGRFEPSSKVCNKCGFINDKLTLKDRKWECEGCGEILNRDYNAACNIRDFALSKQNLVGRETPELTL